MASNSRLSQELGPALAGGDALRPAKDLFRWHLGWLIAAAAGAGLLLGMAAEPDPPVALAFVAVAFAAGFGLALSQRRGVGAERWVVAVWAMAGVMAAALTGGVAGPLAVWLLAPLAAAAAMAKVERLAFGAALAAAGVGLLSALGLAVELPSPDAELAYALQALALITTTLGLGAAMIMLRRRLSFDEACQDDNETRLRQLLDQQPHLLLSLYPSGRVISAHGQEPVPVRGRVPLRRSVGELAAPQYRAAVEEALHETLAGGRSEVEFQAEAEPHVWLTLTLRRSGPSRLAAVLRDTTAQHAREQALDQARLRAEAQNAGKSRFLANMSHELRTPLNAIMGFSDIMRQRLFGAMPDRYGEYAGLIHESGAHLLDLINDVLDMSKIEAERFELAREEFDAREAVSSVLRLMRGQADRAGVQLRGVLPREPLEAIADRRALKQIALNLISNALKFTPRGGAVTVTLNADGAVLELVVSDTGVGIGAEDLARLGKPFEQAGGADQRAAGTGLGLSLVRAFAELHGGEMVIESRLGEGATVTVRMPVLQPLLRPEPAGVR